MTRRLVNADSIPEIKGQLLGRQKHQKNLRINSNANIHWANALEMWSTLCDPFFQALGYHPIEKNLERRRYRKMTNYAFRTTITVIS